MGRGGKQNSAYKISRKTDFAMHRNNGVITGTFFMSNGFASLMLTASVCGEAL